MAAQTALYPASNGESARTLVDILVTQGTFSEDRAKQVKLAEVQTGKSQEEILKSQNLVSETDLVKAKATLYNIPYIDLTNLPASPEALAILPEEVAEKFKVFPISVDTGSKQLVLAMADPLDLSAIEFTEQKTSLRVKPQAASTSKIIEF